MKSTAQFKGHPIHPILVAFPIAFFTATFVFDVVGWIFNPFYFTLAYYIGIAGVITGLLAAIPGIIDYFFTVPPDSSAKKRGAKHGLLNVTNVIIFLLVWVYRRQPDPEPMIIIAAEAIGFILLLIAGWMGGVLVYTNQIGVTNRYANGGRWQEKRIDREDRLIKVAAVNELKLNQMKLLHINGKRIVVGRTENEFVAFDDHCTHHGGSLAGGVMICGTVQCPWHGSQFLVTNGEVYAGPAINKINTYPVTEKNGKLFVSFK